MQASVSTEEKHTPCHRHSTLPFARQALLPVILYKLTGSKGKRYYKGNCLASFTCQEHLGTALSGAKLPGQTCAGSHLGSNAKASLINKPISLSGIKPSASFCLKLCQNTSPALLWRRSWTSELLLQIYTSVSAAF